MTGTVGTILDLTAIAALRSERIDWQFKSFPATACGSTVAEFVDRHESLMTAGFHWPLMTLSESALAHNIVAMANYCAEHEILLAPHGKTTMAPALYERQLQAGAWGITAATVSQVRVYRAFGVPRVLLANELPDAAAARWLSAELDAHAEFEFLCYVDSQEGVRLIAEAWPPNAVRPLDVLVELGHDGGRTGCRTDDQAVELAKAVAAEPGLRLVGVAGYEGSVAHGTGADDLAKVRSFLERIRDAARVFVEDLSLVPGRCVVTAGGSTYFDLVAEIFGELPVPAYQAVLRSGSYVSHDSGVYQTRSPLTRGGTAGLRPAIRVWGQVLSRPEQGRVLVGMGRRDVSFDAGLPVPEVLWRADAVKPLPAPQASVVELNDQHAFLSVGNSGDWAQGDVIGFGISHPCTTFDKWRLIPVLDADHRVVDCVRTYF